MRLKRISAGHYQTRDGKFKIWQEPYDVRFWFIEATEMDETLCPTGFPTRADAVAFLEKHFKQEK